jgi:hypothetical protein
MTHLAAFAGNGSGARAACRAPGWFHASQRGAGRDAGVQRYTRGRDLPSVPGYG